MLTPYSATLIASQIDGPTVTFSASYQSVLPKSAQYTLPAQFFQFIGQAIHVRAAGRMTTSTSPGTVTFQLGMGSLGTTSIAASQAFTLVASQTNITWIVDLWLTLRALDSASAAAANFMFTGTYWAGALNATVFNAIPATAPAVGGNFDNTIANLVDFGVIGSVTTPTCVCHQFQLDAQL
jgi:hypothetical protein